MKQKTIVSLIALVAIIAVAMSAGCNDRKNDKEIIKVGEPFLYTESEANQEYETIQTGENEYMLIDYFYRVTGTTYNTGTATAHNAYVRIIFYDAFGSTNILHNHNIQLGNIGPSDKQSFSYDWSYSRAARVETKAYCDEIPK